MDTKQHTQERLIESYMAQGLTREQAEKAYEAFKERMACPTGKCED